MFKPIQNKRRTPIIALSEAPSMIVYSGGRVVLNEAAHNLFAKGKNFAAIELGVISDENGTKTFGMRYVLASSKNYKPLNKKVEGRGTTYEFRNAGFFQTLEDDKGQPLTRVSFRVGAPDEKTRVMKLIPIDYVVSETRKIKERLIVKRFQEQGK